MARACRRFIVAPTAVDENEIFCIGKDAGTRSRSVLGPRRCLRGPHVSLRAAPAAPNRTGRRPDRAAPWVPHPPLAHCAGASRIGGNSVHTTNDSRSAAVHAYLHVVVYPGVELMVPDRQLGQAGHRIPDTPTGLGSLDRALFDAVAKSSTPFLDKAMPPLTRAANHSKLWLAIAVGLWLSGKPSAQRGAARGVMSLAVSSLVTNQGAKRLWPR